MRAPKERKKLSTKGKHEAIDKHVVGKCFHCGDEFEYVLKKEFIQTHPNLISAIQLYCSPYCEHEEAKKLQKLRREIESQKPRPREKYCPKCATIYSWRKAKEEVDENAV